MAGSDEGVKGYLQQLFLIVSSSVRYTVVKAGIGRLLCGGQYRMAQNFDSGKY